MDFEEFKKEMQKNKARSEGPNDSHLINLKLKSGRQVLLRGFHLKPTYGDIVEGILGEAMNQSIIEWAPESNQWWERKQFTITPTVEEIKTTLPIFHCFIWLFSYEPARDPKAKGSELVIHWFEKSMADGQFFQIIQNAIDKVNWEEEAEDITDELLS